MKENILSVKNLGVSYGDSEVIKDLSFDVKKGENLVVIGPNGSGKTTLFKALIGTIQYSGKIIWEEGIKIGYLPSQESILRDKLLPITVGDFFKLKNIKNSDIEKILEEVNLSKDNIKKDISELSTGQFQRISIGWALSDNPNVILFDEPVSGIDVSGRKNIYDLLHNIWSKRDLTILMISHDLSVVWEHANHVLCIGSSHGVCYGMPRSVLSNENLEKIYGTGIKFYEHKHN